MDSAAEGRLRGPAGGGVAIVNEGMPRSSVTGCTTFTQRNCISRPGRRAGQQRVGESTPRSAKAGARLAEIVIANSAATRRVRRGWACTPERAFVEYYGMVASHSRSAVPRRSGRSGSHTDRPAGPSWARSGDRRKDSTCCSNAWPSLSRFVWESIGRGREGAELDAWRERLCARAWRSRATPRSARTSIAFCRLATRWCPDAYEAFGLGVAERRKAAGAVSARRGRRDVPALRAILLDDPESSTPCQKLRLGGRRCPNRAAACSTLRIACAGAAGPNGRDIDALIQEHDCGLTTGSNGRRPGYAPAPMRRSRAFVTVRWSTRRNAGPARTYGTSSRDDGASVGAGGDARARLFRRRDVQHRRARIAVRTT